MTVAIGSYPALRTIRDGPTPVNASGQPILPPPRLVVFPFRISVNATTRSTHSSGRLTGKGIIRDCFYTVTNLAAANTRQQSLEFGYNPTPVEESLVSPSAQKPWTSLAQRIVGGAADLSAHVVGPFGNPDLTQQVHFNWPLGAPVPLDSWFLIVSVANDSAVAVEYDGVVTVLLGVSDLALANFL
jgi:hypothetical protein